MHKGIVLASIGKFRPAKKMFHHKTALTLNNHDIRKAIPGYFDFQRVRSIP